MKKHKKRKVNPFHGKRRKHQVFDGKHRDNWKQCCYSTTPFDCEIVEEVCRQYCSTNGEYSVHEPVVYTCITGLIQPVRSGGFRSFRLVVSLLAAAFARKI